MPHAVQPRFSCKKQPPQATNTAGRDALSCPMKTRNRFSRAGSLEHGGAVLKVARAYTLTTEDCQDLVQEILLQVWRSLPQFQGESQRIDLVLPRGSEHRPRLAPQRTPPPVRQQPIREVEDLSVAGLGRRPASRSSVKSSNGSMPQFANCPRPTQRSFCSTWTT